MTTHTSRKFPSACGPPSPCTCNPGDTWSSKVYFPASRVNFEPWTTMCASRLRRQGSRGHCLAVRHTMARGHRRPACVCRIDAAEHVARPGEKRTTDKPPCSSASILRERQQPSCLGSRDATMVCFSGVLNHDVPMCSSCTKIGEYAPVKPAAQSPKVLLDFAVNHSSNAPLSAQPCSWCAQEDRQEPAPGQLST